MQMTLTPNTPQPVGTELSLYISGLPANAVLTWSDASDPNATQNPLGTADANGNFSAAAPTTDAQAGATWTNIAYANGQAIGQWSFTVLAPGQSAGLSSNTMIFLAAAVAAYVLYR